MHCLPTCGSHHSPWFMEEWRHIKHFKRCLEHHWWEQKMNSTEHRLKLPLRHTLWEVRASNANISLPFLYLKIANQRSYLRWPKHFLVKEVLRFRVMPRNLQSIHWIKIPKFFLHWMLVFIRIPGSCLGCSLTWEWIDPEEMSLILLIEKLCLAGLWQ